MLLHTEKYFQNLIKSDYIIIRYWMVRWFRLFAIEPTFPLSNFKTKHIFRILMAQRNFIKPFGALPGAPMYFLTPPKANHSAAPGGASPAPQFFFSFLLLPSAKAAVCQMGTGGTPKAAMHPKVPLPIFFMAAKGAANFFYRSTAKWGASGAPILFFTAAKGDGLPQAAPGALLPRRAREIPPKAGVSRVDR